MFYIYNGVSLYDKPDFEYQRIIREMLALGLDVTGKKSIDKSKLNRVKESKYDNFIVELKKQVQAEEYNKKEELEISKIGAITLGDLNRLYFNI